MVAYKSKSTEVVSSQDGTELEPPTETHIGDLSEAYNIGVLRPVQEVRSRMFKPLVERFERMFRRTSSIASQSEPPKDLARMQAKIDMRNAIIGGREAIHDEIAERAEIAILTEHTGSDAEQEARHLDEYSRILRDGLDDIVADKDVMTGIVQRLVKKLANQPPNLILNVHGTFPNIGELRAFVTIGIALQLVAVAIPAIMTYHWRKPKGSNPIQDYAYPTFLLGTCLLFVSIALCSYIIEATTVEQMFIPTDGYRVESIFRLQVQQNMGDQPFEAYVILNHAEDKRIRTSRYDPAEQAGKSRAKAQKSTVVIAVILCFVGFICQFVGLRALHWSATVIQLGITLLMTCIRAWIRRGISNQPIALQLPSSDPNWIALSLGTACRIGWPPGKKPWPTKVAPIFQFCNELPETRSVPVTGLISNDDPRIQLRRKLLSLSTDDGDLFPQAHALLACMHEFFTLLNPRYQRRRPITWSHIFQSSGFVHSSLQNFRLKLTMSFNNPLFLESEQEVLNRNTLHALLSILRYGRGPPPGYQCVTRVYSQEDWIKKRDFLVAQLRGLNPMSYLSTTGHLFNYYEGHMEESVVQYTDFGGMSIENMQPATGSSNAVSSSSCGYLLVSHQSTIHHVPELLSGFMDAVCHEINPKYDHVMKTWYVDIKGSRYWIEVDHIVDEFKALQLEIPDMEAKLLVVASLARCTVWKDSARADEPTPESFPLPKASSRAAPDHP